MGIERVVWVTYLGIKRVVCVTYLGFERVPGHSVHHWRSPVAPWHFHQELPRAIIPGSTHTYTHEQAHIHTCVQARAHTHTCTQVYTHIHMNMHTQNTAAYTRVQHISTCQNIRRANLSGGYGSFLRDRRASSAVTNSQGKEYLSSYT